MLIKGSINPRTKSHFVIYFRVQDFYKALFRVREATCCWFSLGRQHWFFAAIWEVSGLKQAEDAGNAVYTIHEVLVGRGDKWCAYVPTVDLWKRGYLHNACRVDNINGWSFCWILLPVGGSTMIVQSVLVSEKYVTRAPGFWSLFLCNVLLDCNKGVRTVAFNLSFSSLMEPRFSVWPMDFFFFKIFFWTVS